MTPQDFINKWKPVLLSERATAQSHFLDLCKLVGHPDPVSHDPTGEQFTFEKGLTKTGGGDGWADVWKRDHFAWEYKKKKRNLNEAEKQLTLYASALENPPLHVVCDTDRFRIITAWTSTVPKAYEFTLDELVEPEKLAILHAVFFDPEKLKPTKTRAALTKEAADKFSKLASNLQSRGTPDEVAHFINQLVFCFFADSIRLLPDGLFHRLMSAIQRKPQRAQAAFDRLFGVMANKGGELDFEEVPWFNGGLFDGSLALPLDADDVKILWSLYRTRDEHKREVPINWSEIDPTIFGTLFERFLDPGKRAKIGAHYTDAKKIMMIIEPVILQPLRQEWDKHKGLIQSLLAGIIKPPQRAKGKSRMTPLQAAEEERSKFLERLRTLSILDPACGSGNFLYLALQGVKDLELRVNHDCEALGLSPQGSLVGPEILRGIEINPLAAELARTTIWIGDIQWAVRNSIYARPEPVLRKLENIECADALFEIDPSTQAPIEKRWPKADFIIGNPPFLGGKSLRNGRVSKKRSTPGLGDKYVDDLFRVYSGRVPREADLVVYWLARAQELQQKVDAPRVGLVTTNSIRGGVNRQPLVKLSHDKLIFEAWSDEEWIVDGADVRVSITCFGPNDGNLTLNGKRVERINSDLTDYASDLTKAKVLDENAGVAFMGDTKGGPFEVSGDLARQWLVASNNPNGKSNAEVLKPWAHGAEIADRPEDKWIVDFGWTLTEKEAAEFEAPFEYIESYVKPKKAKNRRNSYAKNWWRHTEPRQGMWRALASCNRYIATIRHSKFRSFTWFEKSVLPDSALVVIARDDDVTFGILQSIYHEHWSLRLGTAVGVGNDPRYTPTTTFQTFPFPDGLTPNLDPKTFEADPRAKRIADAARSLHAKRFNWLYPKGLVNEIDEAVEGFPKRRVAKDPSAEAQLKELTLTNLYNARPKWLLDAHRDLDEAVAEAYGWETDIKLEDAISNLLQLNHQRSGIALESAADPDSDEQDDAPEEVEE